MTHELSAVVVVSILEWLDSQVFEGRTSALYTKKSVRQLSLEIGPSIEHS